MSNFFDSEIVQEEMGRVSELQEQIYSKLPIFQSLSKREKECVVELLEELVEKQEILFTRVSLSEDPDAKMLQRSFEDQKRMLGIPIDVSPRQVFNQMKFTQTSWFLVLIIPLITIMQSLYEIPFLDKILKNKHIVENIII